MLPDSDAVNSVYLDRFTGVIAGAKAAVESQHVNKLIVECCTIESATNLEVAKAAEDAEKTSTKDQALASSTLQCQEDLTERLTVLSPSWWERVGPRRLLIGSEVGYCTWETRIAFFFAATPAPGFIVNC